MRIPLDVKCVLGAVAASLALALTGCGQSGTEPVLKDVFADKFYIGAAIDSVELKGADSAGVALLLKHFNSIVPGNCMKSENIHPAEDVYDFRYPDLFVDFGQANGMFIVGHCLVWHSQLAPWFVYDDKGRYVTPEVLKQRMKDHIYTVVGRYKGRVHGWDVVNEAILEDGSYRKSPFYEILGEEYIPLAFQYAHEADPDAELYINDYGMNAAGRRDTYVKIVNDLKSRGLRIDAVGMQGHMGIDYPSVEDFEKSLLAFAATGCSVMITEWDMSALPTVNTGANVSETEKYEASLDPYPDGLPADIDSLWNKRMSDFMHLFVKHADKITRVTTWGVSDDDSWKNDWPVKGRTDYPLMFDRNLQPKPFLNEWLQ